MKKSILALAVVVVLSVSTLPALAAMGGGIPRPQQETEPGFVDGVIGAVSAMLGL